MGLEAETIRAILATRILDVMRKCLEVLVGAKGFEPSTPASRTQCATGLRYAPTGEVLKGSESILHERVETQAVRLGDAAASHFPLREVHALRQSCIGTDGGLHAG